MKIELKKHFKALIIVAILLIIPSFISAPSKINPRRRWVNDLPENYDFLRNSYNATMGYEARKNIYLTDSNTSDGIYAQSSRVYLNESVNEASFQSSLDKINNREDTADFRMGSILRTMYLDNKTNVLEPSFKLQLKNAILGFKYWFTEPNDDAMIMWTENHMILFHSCELLAGQLYPNETFTNSGMNGTQHVKHALPLVNRWLNWRARFGFSEWHSDIYYEEDLMPLLNLVEFAQDNDTATKAAMLVDILAFDFANNYFKGIYATTNGRTDDHKKVGTSLTDPPSRASFAEFAWILLGVGHHEESGSSSMSAVALSTSDKYKPPPILEAIANATLDYNEHRDRNGINIADGPSYGFGYESEDDLMFWWPMSTLVAGPVIEPTLDLMNTYDLDPNLIFEDELLIDLLKIAADFYGSTLSELCTFLKEATQGVALEEANTYTYRTPYYQLSGAQDHQKGLMGMQEHIWQASLDEYATVFTNSHGGFRGEDHVGGFKPRATLYKNVGVIQYDRLSQSLILELVYAILEFKDITQAYFPRWAFNEVVQQDKWTFGRRLDSYVALYSNEPQEWEDGIFLTSQGKKNVYIVELGSVEDYGTFANFTSSILATKLDVIHLSVGYGVRYVSPTQGTVKVNWDGPMTVNGAQVDLGSYARFDNDFCFQDFNTQKTTIQYGTMTLELDFENATRTYTEL
ncbi:MAG: hypothetical protein HWN79_15585 [Candidatus Lokiarchaeota archaeon]|nr:hypothetical protein [Candidatus Lokiarchaeota archaeon]